jgi:bacterioferritin-associated ferredoxin
MSTPEDGAPGASPRLVCRCLGVSSRRLVETARDGTGTLTSLDRVQAATRAGTGCGTCHPEIQEILCDLAGDAYPPAQRLRNRRICQSETEARIERALLPWLAPRAAQGGSLEVIAVRGLRVELRLVPDAPAFRSTIAERLRKCVCGELELTFSS